MGSSITTLLLAALMVCSVMSLMIMTQNVDANLDEQIQQLNDLMLRRPVIKLNADKFRRFIGSQSIPRNYSFVVMMTAMSPQRSCQICRLAHEEFTIVANSFRMSQHADSKRLYFGSVDYDDGSEIFNSLSINSAPCFLYFNDKGKFTKPDELNIQRLGFGADVITRWIHEKTGMSIKIVRPPNYSAPILMVLFGMTVATFLYMCRSSLGILFLNKNVWALTAVAIVLTMTSGQMWNHIRGAPLMQRGRNQNNYIHGSSSGQFVVETYLVLLMNAGIAIGMVLMTDALKSGGDKFEKKKLLARIGFIMMVIFFSLLLSIFRQKSYGYPYRLLF